MSDGFGLPGAATMQVASSDIDHVVKLLNAGASPEDIRCQLVDRGFDEQSAATVVQNLLLQPVRAEAAALLNSGLTSKQAEQRLIDSGVDQSVASAVINDLLQAHARATNAQSGGRNPAAYFLGGIVFVLGIVLLIGNVTGLFPTFPFAGFIAMAIGGAIMGAGRAG